MKSSASEPGLSSILGNLPRSRSLQLLEIFIEEDFSKKKMSEESTGSDFFLCPLMVDSLHLPLFPL